jgi:hypothetical protein
VLADVVAVDDPQIPLTGGYDKPDRLADQLEWLAGAGFGRVEVTWEERDLAVLWAALAQ